jgi:hypothetical protein
LHAVDAAYNPAEWGTFAVGLTTASGALTRLVFVAVSIRVKEVLDDPFHRRRTESTFVILLAILTASLLVLMRARVEWRSGSRCSWSALCSPTARPTRGV